ncbi:MAG: VCBS repeat-containing protein [Phycisphaerae bacterium]|nr:VCBS repeat-containing protein [Phycisphaerae bacterium]
MKSRPNTGFGFLLIGIILFLGCRSMYLDTQTDGDATGSGFAATGVAGSFFKAIQIDPRSEDSAGPVFVVAGDLDGDSLMDLVSAWNESQPIQAHLQRRNAAGEIAFETVPLGGTAPIARVAGLELADMDADGWLDVVVLVKDTGQVASCDESREDCDVTDNGGRIEGAIEGGIIIFYNPQDTTGVPWSVTKLTTSFLAGRDEGESLEEGGYTSLAVGEIDGINGPDIVVAFNSAEGNAELPLEPADGLPQLNSVDLWANPGPDQARKGEQWSRAMIYADLPPVGACRILDVDRDGDMDAVCTYPSAASSNVRWIPNPLDLGDQAKVYDFWGIGAMYAPVGQISTGADSLAIGDLDNDGIDDILVRSSQGQVVQWFKAPALPPFDFIRSPWRVYTLAEFREREPQAMAVGDLTGNGRMEVAVSAEGAVAWFDSQDAMDEFDQWGETLIIDDAPSDTSANADPDPNGNDNAAGLSDMLALLTDPQQQSQPENTVTLVNSLLIADIDGDGRNDMIGTLDRTDGSGLTNDALILFRNERKN